MPQAMTIGLDQTNARRRNPALDLLGGLLSRFLRLGLVILGILVMIAGFLIAPLPGPFGLPVAVVGLMMVLRNSMWAKRRFIDAKRRWPNWVYPFRRLMRREPEVVPVFWQQALRTERMVFSRRARFLASARRRLFRRKRRQALSKT